ncbi:MAG: transporter substrate-binding domain-containing protein [Telmatospirillum sp.]|nr:transporter substrate-binding domain-containing protein [Telmatospirillum sp.]
MNALSTDPAARAPLAGSRTGPAAGLICLCACLVLFGLIAGIEAGSVGDALGRIGAPGAAAVPPLEAARGALGVITAAAWGAALAGIVVTALALWRRTGGSALPSRGTGSPADIAPPVLSRTADPAALKTEIARHRERAAGITALAARFDTEALEMVQSVAGAAMTLKTMATSLTTTAGETREQSDRVSTLTRTASANTQTVASAAEELTASIGEISRQVARSATVWHGAAEAAAHASAEVAELAAAAGKIGAIVDLIKAIASQTNLLALNAAIEAARAGEQGRGFAVVAGEVKALAMQTVAATADIGNQISAVQQQTGKVVDSIEGITRVLAEVEEISGSIAAAVEEQNSATREIGRNVAEVARATNEVSANVSGIHSAAEGTGGAAADVLNAALGLAGQANQLRSITRTFLDEVMLADAEVAPRRSDNPLEVVFVAGDIPPYAMPRGQDPDGAAVRILESLAADLGLPFSVDFRPWQLAQKMAQSNGGVGVIPLSRTPEREPLYRWIGPIVADQEVLLFRAGGRPVPARLEEARDWPVAVLRGSAGESVLIKAGFTNLQAVNDPASCARLLEEGKVDAWSAARLVGPYQYRLNGLDPARLLAGPVVRPNDIYLGLARQTPDEVTACWQAALERVRAAGTTDRILRAFA